MMTSKAPAHEATATASDEARKTARADLAVARRYLEHGFLDAAIRLLVRNAADVTPADWDRLAGRLMERGRVADAVSICQTGGVPLPRQELLARGDRQLRRKDFDGAIHFYELAEADRGRWSHLVDVLTGLPDRELRALAIAERHLVGEVRTEARLAAAS